MTVTKDRFSITQQPASPEAMMPLASDPFTCDGDGSKTAGTPKTAGGAAGDAPRRDADEGARRILLVDDHADMLAMMKLVLSRRGYEVQTHSDARAALQAARAFQPHVVISDIGMPNMNGLEFMRALRSDGALSPFKSVALTGFSSDGDEADALAAGFEVCLVKPVDFTALFRCLDELCPAQH
jgi:CheY-like chemotaxis protein